MVQITSSEKQNSNIGFSNKKDSMDSTKSGVTKKEFTNNNSEIVSTVKVCPWVRYWARILDIYIFACIFGIFLGIFIPSVLVPISDSYGGIFLSMLVLFIWVFIESILLSKWGTTPGKWLLNVQLKDENGGKPKFAKALNRSFAVWTGGLGLGIPILIFFTALNSYNRLIKEGITSWDEEGHFTITHGKIGVTRIIVAVVLIIVISVIYFLSD